jgi:putative tryptophan/tyrosine transport system substrate-binding protein
MRRREFIAALGGAAARGARAGAGAPSRCPDRHRQRSRSTGAFYYLRAGARQLGWVVGRNVRIDSRWGGGDAAVIRKHAADLVALGPDVIMATGGASGAALNRG